MHNLKKAVQQLKKERDQARRKVEQLDTALKIFGQPRWIEARSGSGNWTSNHVSRCSQTNRRRPTCALGEMEGG